MNRIAELREDAKRRTPDKWYFNQYENGRLISQSGFPTRKMAETRMRIIDEEIESMVRQGAKLRPGITHAVVEAKGWSVDDREFSDFAEALLYKWTERPSHKVLGIF